MQLFLFHTASPRYLNWRGIVSLWQHAACAVPAGDVALPRYRMCWAPRCCVLAEPPASVPLLPPDCSTPQLVPLSLVPRETSRSYLAGGKKKKTSTFSGMLLLSQINFLTWLTALMWKTAGLAQPGGQHTGVGTSREEQPRLNSELLPKTLHHEATAELQSGDKAQPNQRCALGDAEIPQLFFSIFEVRGMNLGLHFSPSEILLSYWTAYFHQCK